MSTDYNELPDYMTVSELQELFRGFLEAVNNPNGVNLDLFIAGLSELSNRQWHTYTILEENLRTNIDDWVKAILISDIWQTKSVYFIRQMLSAIGNLGLVNSYLFVKEISNREIDPSLKNEISDFISEIDKFKNGHVDDPYIST